MRVKITLACTECKQRNYNTKKNKMCIRDSLFFFSAQLPRLSALLRRYPEVRVDLTPGIELYTNLARDIPAARAFFEEFGTRILYGSDIGSREMCIRDRDSCARWRCFWRSCRCSLGNRAGWCRAGCLRPPR